MKNIFISVPTLRVVLHLSLIFTIMAALIATPARVQAATDPRPNRNSLKIEIVSPGIYRVSGSDFTAANVNPANIDPETFRIFLRDTEIPVTVSAGDGVFDSIDFVEFYAPGIDNQYTETEVYWLYWNGIAGKRLSWVNHAPDGSVTPITSFSQNVTIEENHVMWSNTPNAPDTDYWFWEKLTAPQSSAQTSTHTFDLPSPVNKSEEALATVYFQGSTDNGHHTIITLNGQTIGDAIWFGTIAKGQVSTISPNLLKNRLNELTVESAGDISSSGDVIYLNRLGITYQRDLKAVDNHLTFQLKQEDASPVSVSGFTTASIRLFDITDPDNVTKMAGLDIEPSGTDYTVVFQHKGGVKTYLALTADAVKRADRIEYKKPYDLKNVSNQADYILITGKELMPGLERLCELRRRQGLGVKMVSIEDIYDVFSFGFFDPVAVKNFLKYTHDSWSHPVPEYVLLAGDSNLDYRNYYGTAKKNIVPVYLSNTFELGLTPSDNWFVSFENSPLPELYIGRISGSDPETMSDIADKIIRYETSAGYAPEQALFVADDDDPLFEDLNDDLASYLTSAFTANKVYAQYYDSLDNVTRNVLSFIDKGMLITNFVGHGDVTRWGAEPFGGGDFILEPGDINRLNNQNKLTFIIALNCLNGYFSQPFEYSLAEEWLMAPDTGAIACVAPSGLSHQWEHELFSEFIFDRIFNEQENSIGAISTESKIDAYLSGASEKVLVSLNLIGDPATKLAIHRNPGDMVKVYEIAASAGTGGTIMPAGDIPAFEDSKETFTITPNTGYHILNITVDGVSQGAVGQYTFNNISSDHSISAEFENDNNTGGSGGGGGGGCFISSLQD